MNKEQAFETICGTDCDPFDVTEDDIRDMARYWNSIGGECSEEMINAAIGYVQDYIDDYLESFSNVNEKANDL